MDLSQTAVPPPPLNDADEPLGAPEEQEPDYADDSAILEEISELEREGLQLRVREEQAWLEAWRFYNGKHWSTWRQDGSFDDREDDEDVPHIVLNFILNMVQTRLGHLIKNRPILSGLPGKNDEIARNATRMAVQVLQAYWRKLKLPKKAAQAILWTLVCGKCFWKIWWDPYAGRTLTRVVPGNPVLDELGQPVLDENGEIRLEQRQETYKEGDLAVEVCFPHEVMVDVGAMDIDQAQRLLHTTYWTLAKVVEAFNIDKEEAEQLRTSVLNDEGVNRARRQLEGLDAAAGIDRRGKVPVKELWIRPNEKYPAGLWAIECGGKVFRKEPWPRSYKTLPYVEFDEIKTNSFYSTSTARQLLDVNRIINIEVSQQEHLRRVLRYKTLVPEQANIDRDAFDQRDDEVITYWAPYAPSHLKPPELTQHHVEIRNSLINIIKEIGGNWDVLAGKTQGDVRSGRQTAYLQEYAGTVLGVVARQIEWAFEGAGNQMLAHLQEVEEPRLESFVGRDRRVQVLSFKGVDLQGCSEIVVQPDSALPISRTERWDRVERWMEQGWLDPKIGTRLLDLGDYDQDLYADEEQDRENADEIVWKLNAVTEDAIKAAHPVSQQLAATEGMMWSERYLLRALGIEAYPFDNHEIHVKQIDKICRKARMYREDWPRVKRALADALVEWHGMLADPMHGPIEQPLVPTGMPAIRGARLPPGSDPRRAGPITGLGPDGKPSRNGGAGPQMPGAPDLAGGPEAMQPGGQGQGPGGAGQPGAPHYMAESGQERAEGLPGVPRPPGPAPGQGTI